MAPELCAEKEYNEMVDVWSSGVIAFILLTGKPPFLGKSKDAIYKSIQFNEPDYNALTKCSSQCADFVKQCLEKDPKNRPSTADLLKHPWLSLANDRQALDNTVALDISANLAAFRKTNAFQTGVLSFITNIQIRSE